ncbi:mitochondrial uncoupling protein 4-like protein [Dinothrombium tinctorium]|uniref:Mitochondrial uncoupling protein 4-like protein n=1 Tax=Dinothrombium tinctorium TaxID=1965070 RepID=A0A3S3QF72_9ACAR|nr:mitochondrial uncoupling protein 4-like protein [Dinothrombium tinctorium]RWS08008.1 mitochondrial uncoupling protein 4-like protein [Dinothrombium tinctorium]RWS08088.1 mitochondrial uncoupling protein 4-like protein [Dinothrombium tinctorium]
MRPLFSQQVVRNWVRSYSLDFCRNCEQIELIPVTYPLDLTKTRLQLQGEAAVNAFNQKLGPSKPELKRGMLKTAFGIVKQIEIEGDLFLVKEEGFFKLWRGMPPAVNRHLIYSGTRLTVYELIRDTLGKNEDGTLSLWKAVCGGVIAGGFAQFLASPADLVKVQIQAEGKRRMQGLPPRVRNSWHAFTKIINEGGVRGLWKGWVPNVQRAALVNLGDLTTYDTAKRIILNHTKLKDNYFTHALARQDLLIRSQTIIDFFHSTFSGLVAATFGTPADTIKTRIMNQPTDEHGRGLVYKGSIDCFMKCVKQEGFFSLYKGFIPCWMRMGPWSLTFWITYEKFRNWGGVKSF